MTKTSAGFLVGLFIGALMVVHAQTDSPKNFAGADFLCTYITTTNPKEPCALNQDAVYLEFRLSSFLVLES